MELKKTGRFYRDENGRFISKAIAEQILAKQAELEIGRAAGRERG